MSVPEVELALDMHATIGESMVWCADRQVLFWIDVKAPALHCFDPSGNGNRTWSLPSEVGCIAVDTAGTTAMVALRDGLFRMDLPDGALTHCADPPFDPCTHRFNEGGCDSTGRFWMGTMFDPRPGVTADPLPGHLYSFSPREGLRVHQDVAMTANGLAWTADGQTMFLAHSQRHNVWAYPFDAATGRLGRPRPFINVPESLGIPDGAAMDVDNGYWLAIHGGGRVRRYRLDGTLDREIPVPVENPTMCAFAGPDMDTMFITTATHGKAPPPAGGLFRCRPGVRGLQTASFVP